MFIVRISVEEIGNFLKKRNRAVRRNRYRIVIISTRRWPSEFLTHMLMKLPWSGLLFD